MQEKLSETNGSTRFISNPEASESVSHARKVSGWQSTTCREIPLRRDDNRVEISKFRKTLSPISKVSHDSVGTKPTQPSQKAIAYETSNTEKTKGSTDIDTSVIRKIFG